MTTASSSAASRTPSLRSITPRARTGVGLIGRLARPANRGPGSVAVRSRRKKRYGSRVCVLGGPIYPHPAKSQCSVPITAEFPSHSNMLEGETPLTCEPRSENTHRVVHRLGQRGCTIPKRCLQKWNDLLPWRSGRNRRQQNDADHARALAKGAAPPAAARIRSPPGSPAAGAGGQRRDAGVQRQLHPGSARVPCGKMTICRCSASARGLPQQPAQRRGAGRPVDRDHPGRQQHGPEQRDARSVPASARRRSAARSAPRPACRTPTGASRRSAPGPSRQLCRSTR